MANVVTFEADIAAQANQLLAVYANLTRISDQRWSDATGAGYEGIYNALANQGDKPATGAITKNQMNNAISALNSVKAAIEAASAALATVAEFDPDLLNNE